jgi:hypothetical protein
VVVRVKREVPRLSFWERFDNVPTLELRPGEEFIFRTRAFLRIGWGWPGVRGYLLCTNQRLVWRRHNQPPWIIEQPGDLIEFPREDIASVDAPALVGDMDRPRGGREFVDICTTRGLRHTYLLSTHEGWVSVLDEWVKQT